jgi:hypothetical protein
VTARAASSKRWAVKGGPDIVAKVIRFDIEVGSTRSLCNLRLLQFDFEMKFFVVFTAKSCRNTPVNFACLSSLTRKTLNSFSRNSILGIGSFTKFCRNERE